MNVAFIVIIVFEIATAFTRTEAFPNWWRGSKDKHTWWNHHHHSDTYGCAVGQCVLACDCPKAAVAVGSEKDSCIYRENGPWVCCHVNDESFHDWEDTSVYNSEGPNNSKRTTTKLLKVSTASTTQKYGYDEYDGTRKPLSKDTRNKNKEQEVPLIRSIGSSSVNEREQYPFYRPKNKTTSTKIPNISTANNVPKNYNKSTESINYKRTTNLWDKPRASTSRPNDFKRTTKLPNKLRTSTPSTTYKKTTNLWDKPRSSTPSTIYKKTTNLWDKPRPSKPRIIFPSEAATRHFTPSLSTSTKRPWTRSTSTKATWEHTTANTRRTVSTTTKHPYSKKSTAATKASTQRSNQIWGRSTTSHPTRTQTSKPKTTRPSSVRSTIKSTRRHSVTTPLPNVNIHLCGLRDERTTGRRQGRDGYYGRDPVTDAVYSDNTRSRSRLPFQRIVGGKEAEPFSWPWMAALYKVTSSGGNRFLSAGTLINEDFILTAAHVFTSDDLRTSSYVVMLGTHDAQDAVAQYVVSSVLLHPNYEHRYYYNDIALLKLEKKVVFNNYIMPICLPSPNAPLHADKDLLGKNVTVMGWGDDSFGGKSSQVLKEATFPIASRRSCNASYVRVASNRFPKGITAEMLCAGDPKGGKDACQGDSGGPLTVIAKGRFTQVGIVSFGYKCGDKEYPGVYTKVAPYLSWIAENTKYVADYDYYG